LTLGEGVFLKVQMPSKNKSFVPSLLGVFVLLVSLAHVPAFIPSLNAFDPLKQLLWASGYLVLLVSTLFFKKLDNVNLFTPLLLLLAWIVARTLLRPIPLREIEVLLNWTAPLLAFVVGRIFYSAFMKRVDLQTLGGWLVVIAGIQLLLMIVQYAGIDPLFTETTTGFAYHPARMIGTIGYHNQAVDFLCVCLAGLWLLKGSQKWRLPCLVICALVIVLSANRGGSIAFLTAVISVVGFQLWVLETKRRTLSRRQVLSGLGGVLLVVIVIFALPQSRTRFLELVYHLDQSVAVQSRLWFHRVALDLWKEFPMAGAGAGEYAYQFLPTLARLTPAAKTHELLVSMVFARETHLDLLQFAAEFGWFILSESRHLKKTIRDQDAIAINSAIIWIVTYMAVSSLFNFSWQTAAAGPCAGLLLGILLPTDSDQRGPKLLITKSILIVLLISTYFAWTYQRVRLKWTLRVPVVLASGSFTDEKIPLWLYQVKALQGAELARRGNPTQGLEVLENAGTGYQDILIWNNQANIHMQREEWVEAIDLYQKWADTGIQYEQAIGNLSVALESNGEALQAAEVLARKLSLWLPETTKPIQRVSVLFLTGQRPDKTLHVLNKYYGIWQTFPLKEQAILWNIKGASQYQLGNKEDAMVSFQLAVEMDSGLLSAKRNLENLKRSFTSTEYELN
jgi:hypothetical protein